MTLPEQEPDPQEPEHQESEHQEPDHSVVLLHGLALGPWAMALMARRFERRGWVVRRIGYRSTSQRFDASLAAVRARMPDGPVHIVGHSLGGLLGAAMLRDPDGLQIGRVVQLGSPNLGSPQALRAGWLAPLRWFYGPVLPQLVPHDGPVTPDPRIGAVAGDIWPNVSGGRGDGTVRLESAIAAAGDHVTVRVMHTLLPFSGRVAAHAADFVAHGRFGGAEGGKT